MEKLISILVVTYNSSEFIEETLESIKNQTYKNLELIITDDCSNDNTIEICKLWIKNNPNRFIKTELVTTSINTGIPANCNRGLKKCSGEWIKMVAGDDLLLPTAINDYISSIDKEDNIVYSKIQAFTVIDNNKKLLNIAPEANRLPLFKLTAKEQNKVMCQMFFPGCSPSIFIKNQMLKDLNYYEEKYKYIDDWSFCFRATKQGYKLNFIDKITVLYRIHSNNISRNKKNNFFNKKHFESLQLFRKNEIYPTLSSWNKIVFFETYLLDMFEYLVITKIFNNKVNIISKYIHSVIKRLRLEKYFKYYDY